MTGFKWQVVVCQFPLSLPAEVDADRHKGLRRVDWSEQAQQTGRSWILIGCTRTALQVEAYSCLHLLWFLSGLTPLTFGIQT